MKHAAAKQEPEVIADPRGTAVNVATAAAQPVAGSSGPRARLAGRTYRTQSLDVDSAHFKEIGGDKATEEVPMGPERRIHVRALRRTSEPGGERLVPEPLPAMPLVKAPGRRAGRSRGRLRRDDGTRGRGTGRPPRMDDRPPLHTVRHCPAKPVRARRPGAAGSLRCGYRDSRRQ